MAKDDIVPVTQNVFSDLTIEELEQRLEMQLLGVPDADWCAINDCGVQCSTACGVNGS